MAILNLVDKHNPLLRQTMEDFDFSNPPTDPIQLAKDLTETMLHHKGLGIAANQCGLPYRVFALTGERITVCFNPKIVFSSEQLVYINEGCLTYPGVIVKIKRPAILRVRFTMPNGETTTTRFEGLSARCFQHEMDHLNGIVHLSRANQFHKRKALKLKRIYNKIVEANLMKKVKS